MPNPTAAMLVIGDEILSGRTREANMHHLAGVLTERGIDLKEVRVVSDEQSVIVPAVRYLSETYTHLFTSGGIGPTHDDITADAVAIAMGAQIDVREDAQAILAAHYAQSGTELNAARLRMARIPEGAALIDNPVSAAPGFTLGNVHVMAGVPRIFEAMVASLMPRLTGGVPLLSRSVRVERPEGEVAGPLGDLAQVHAELSFGSYPFHSETGIGTNVVIRGTDSGMLDAAEVSLRERLAETPPT
ncbi:MAG: molybdopterin-binding protein [Pseudomonadota bacterium]